MWQPPMPPQRRQGAGQAPLPSCGKLLDARPARCIHCPSIGSLQLTYIMSLKQPEKVSGERCRPAREQVRRSKSKSNVQSASHSREERDGKLGTRRY